MIFVSADFDSRVGFQNYKALAGDNYWALAGMVFNHNSDSHKERISVILVYKRLVFPPTGTEGIKLNTVPGHVRKYGQLNK